MNQKNMSDNKITQHQLEKLSDEEIDEVKKSISKNPEEVYELLLERTEYKSELFAGPLPHPDTLIGYKEIDSSFPDRIINMAEKDAEHQRKMDEYLITENFKNNTRGMIFGFIISLVTIFLGTFLIYIGKNIYGLVAILTPLVGIASTFVIGNKSNHDKESDDIKNNS